MNNQIEFTKGSGNVFEDLGLNNADELLAKSNLAHTILDTIQRRNLTQAEAARILGINQTLLSRLETSDGKNCMSFDLLIEWITKLGNNITVIVETNPKENEEGEIKVAV